MLEKVREFGAKVKGKIMLSAGAVSAAVVSTGVMAFASEAGSSGPSIVITEAMLTPVTEGIVANMAVILPVGLGIFGIFTAVKLIPKLIKIFINV